MRFRDLRPATKADIDRMERRIMAALNDLQAAVLGLGTDLDSELAAIEAKLSIPGGTSDADIEAVVASIGSLRLKVQAETSKLSGTTVTPAPTPTV